MHAFNLAHVRQDFPIVETAVYVNHAAVAPLPRSVQAAMLEQSHIHMRQPDKAWDITRLKYEEGRRLAAKLVNGMAKQIAYIQNTSHGISLIANGLPWQAGDNVLVPAQEFPSNYLVWQALQQRGVEVRHIPAVNGRLTADQVRPLIDQRTRVVTLSHVQYYNGFRVDLAPIGELCRRHDALLVVDGTQSIGAMTLDTAVCGVDVLVVSAHKWMMGPLGIGFMALSPRAMAQVNVTIVGWLSVSDPFDFTRDKQLLPDANRFESGTENAAGKYGLLARLQQIEALGAIVIERRVLFLTDRLCANLQANGFQVTSPRREGEKSAIVTFVHEQIPGDQLLDKLQKANIIASLRPGGIRISPHYYNSEEEIDLIVACLASK